MDASYDNIRNFLESYRAEIALRPSTSGGGNVSRAREGLKYMHRDTQDAIGVKRDRIATVSLVDSMQELSSTHYWRYCPLFTANP